MKVLQHWDGWVEEIADGKVYVTLIDITAGDTRPSETAEMPIKSISPAVMEKLQRGSLITWKIEQQDDGKTVSRFELTPVGVWTEEDIAAADADAKRLLLALRWDQG